MPALPEIIANKREEISALRLNEVELRLAAEEASPAREWTIPRGDHRIGVIAEIKRRSPSKGVLATDIDPAATALEYVAGGADAISVLTDRSFFDGSINDFQRARDAVSVPVLRKDFVIDPVQVFETRAIGADVMLLIVAAIDDRGLLRDLHTQAREFGMQVLVEVCNERELDLAQEIQAGMVGVNSRDLFTFDEDLSVAHRLIASIPREIVAVAESSIRKPDDVEDLAALGYDAVLVGEALVRATDRAETLRELVANAQRAER